MGRYLSLWSALGWRCRFTQETLAEMAGLTGRTLSAIETGNANPTWATVRDIARALRVPVSEVAKLAEDLASP